MRQCFCLRRFDRRHECERNLIFAKYLHKPSWFNPHSSKLKPSESRLNYTRIAATPPHHSQPYARKLLASIFNHFILTDWNPIHYTMCQRRYTELRTGFVLIMQAWKHCPMVSWYLWIWCAAAHQVNALTDIPLRWCLLGHVVKLATMRQSIILIATHVTV